MTGILIVHKPQDWTSHDVVAKLRGLFREKRIGHAGTLDPMATGVLPVFLGRATRAVEFATEGHKEYIAGIRLGQTSDTQDSTGAILTNTPHSVSEKELMDVFPQFMGDIMQIPPMYSAIKIQGKKLYELARKGKEVERPPRPITISSITLLPEKNQFGDPLLKISCSKGTYIRTICHDIGAELGCGAVMSSLQRTTAAGFTLEQSHHLSDILEHPTPHSLLLPVESYFTQEKLTVLPWQEKKIRNGADFSLSSTQMVECGQYCTYNEQGQFLALSQITSGNVHTIKSFFEVETQ